MSCRRAYEPATGLKMFPLIAALWIAAVSAASTPIATSPIISTITSTYYSTTSSIISTSRSIGIDPDTCIASTASTGTTVCLAGAASATEIPIYATDIVTLTTKVVSTVGYTTIYSDVTDPIATTTSVDTGPFVFGGGDSSASTISGSSDSATSITSSTSTDKADSANNSGTDSSSNGSSSNSSTNNDSSDESNSSGNSSSLGLEVGIAVAILLGALIGGCAAFFYVKRRQHRTALVQVIPPADEEKHSSAGHEMKQYTGSPSTDDLTAHNSNTGADDNYSMNTYGTGAGDNQSHHENQVILSSRPGGGPGSSS